MLSTGFAQSKTIIRLAFSDTSNFGLTKMPGARPPARYYLLDSTDKWDSDRFYYNDLVTKADTSDEHSRYQNFIFKDAALNTVVSRHEQKLLYMSGERSVKKKISLTDPRLTLIRSFTRLRSGCFFSVTEPLYTSDRNFAFLDITVYRIDKDTKEFRDCFFGDVLLIYKKTSSGSWIKYKKLERWYN